jgi:hypothetical protein
MYNSVKLPILESTITATKPRLSQVRNVGWEAEIRCALIARAGEQKREKNSNPNQSKVYQRACHFWNC